MSGLSYYMGDIYPDIQRSLLQDTSLEANIGEEAQDKLGEEKTTPVTKNNLNFKKLVLIVVLVAICIIILGGIK